VHVMGRDDIYPVRMSKVGCHCSGNRPWILDFSTPDDGSRKRPKLV